MNKEVRTGWCSFHQNLSKLDVYKRQIPYEYSRLIQLFRHTNQAFPFEGNRVSVYTEGYTKLQALYVSYTHLDVYKRQSLG